ncbi:transcription factor MYB1R1 [Capsicum chacoense]
MTITYGHSSFISAGELPPADVSGGEIMLFGVRVKVDPMRKSVSLNNLSQYEQPNSNDNNNSNGGNTNDSSSKVADEGYASADDAVPHHSGSGRERKRGQISDYFALFLCSYGLWRSNCFSQFFCLLIFFLSQLLIDHISDFKYFLVLCCYSSSVPLINLAVFGFHFLGVPWTEEEHKLFLLGLQKVGKGDWRGISRNFVKTRTPTQVASHAQKYFLRRTNLNRRRRRRSSLFDITTDSVSVLPTEEAKNLQEAHVETSKINAFQVTSVPIKFAPLVLPAQMDKPIESPIQSYNASSIYLRPVPVVVPVSNQSSAIESSSLSLTLSLSSPSSSSTRYQVMSNFSNGESIISVA